MSDNKFVDLPILISEKQKTPQISYLTNGVSFLKNKFHKKSKSIIKLFEFSYLKWDKRQIPVDSLVEVRKGHFTAKFLSNSSINENNCISLIYKKNDHNLGIYDIKSLDLEFESKELRDKCVESLEYLIELNKEILGDVTELSRVWRTFEKEKLKEKDVKKLFELLNFDVSSKEVERYLKQYDENGDNLLDFSEFVSMIFVLKERNSLVDIYDKLRLDDPKNLQLFLKESQREEVSLQECERIIRQYKTGSKFDKLGFQQYMLSEENNVMDPKYGSIYQDLNHPLNHYFIDSSHNTYLSGHQLKGESSIEMYSSALRRGCRCVELDVWDGEKEPMIKHGYTLTSKINLRDVCKVIARNAFISNPYPVILSIENHTTKVQQDMMAEIFKETLGHLLASPSILSNATALPSPKALLNKIILKGTMFSTPLIDPNQIKEFQEKKEKGEIVVEEDSYEEEIEEDDENEKEEKHLTKDKKSPVTNEKKKGFFEKKKHKKEQKKGSQKEVPNPKGKEKISEELAKLIFLKSAGFRGFEVSSNNKPHEMCSFSEGILEKGQIELHQKYNEKLLSRIYPKGTRFDSSNYDPIPHWECGSQIVALNYQTSSTPMKLNRGKFRENGRIGYVLQPRYHSTKISFPYKKLKISKLSGRQFPRSGETSDPYVSISLHGEKREQSFNTSVVDNNGFNPDWEKEVFQFDIENAPNSLLLFEVKDKDYVGHKNMGHFAIPIHCVRPGYRIIFLEDSLDNRIHKGGANLFALFEFF
eukprot:TRINITY_DN204_c0_g2_i1.p1 TRINITY_DN204_c0_g2~~TRINITY_DN204_c0_g2_i1.p1  ORF type:complete len:766 (-),score=273.84 TRINITY_DN204_c0_g2_i1:34-2310(-)